MNRETFHDIAQLVIGLALIAGCFMFLFALYFSGKPFDPALKESLLQTNGAVLGIVGVIVGFYFGTSLSSLRKDNKKEVTPSA